MWNSMDDIKTKIGQATFKFRLVSNQFVLFNLSYTFEDFRKVATSFITGQLWCSSSWTSVSCFARLHFWKWDQRSNFYLIEHILGLEYQRLTGTQKVTQVDFLIGLHLCPIFPSVSYLRPDLISMRWKSSFLRRAENMHGRFLLPLLFPLKKIHSFFVLLSTMLTRRILVHRSLAFASRRMYRIDWSRETVHRFLEWPDMLAVAEGESTIIF